MDGYYAFMLVATALVLMMTVPALALFYGGMSRSKSVLNMMMMSFISAAIVGILYVAVGWSMGFGGEGSFGTFFADPTDLFWLDGVTTDSYIYVMFQMTFAIITAALISGAVADRMKFSAWVVFVPLWALLCYFPMAHMVFSCTDDSLICGRIGAQDYAGGTAVHINAGVAALVLVLLLGKRVGWPKDKMRPHNLTLTMLGAGMLWLGWYGFNVGSIVFGGESPEADMAQFFSETGRTFANTTLATMAAILGWLIVERVLHGKATSLGAASGIVAGLVAVTPAAGAVDIEGAVAIGAIAGAVCAWAVSLKFKLGYDDSLDVVGVHLVGGIVGTVLIGFFSTADGAGGIDGIFYGGGADSLVDQILGVLVAVAYSGVVTLVIGLVIKYTLGLRISEEDEVDGIDLSEHGETAYDLHTGGGGSSIFATSSEGAHK
ncbi:MAG: ammonium transporter [Nocardioides sp.]